MAEMTEWMHRRENPNMDVLDTLLSVVQAFEHGLTDEEELGMFIANAPTPIHIDIIARMSSHFLTFVGSDPEGQRIVALQHVDQLSFQLVTLKKRKEQAVRVGFGFSSPEQSGR